MDLREQVHMQDVLCTSTSSLKMVLTDLVHLIRQLFTVFDLWCKGFVLWNKTSLELEVCGNSHSPIQCGTEISYVFNQRNKLFEPTQWRQVEVENFYVNMFCFCKYIRWPNFLLLFCFSSLCFNDNIYWAIK